MYFLLVKLPATLMNLLIGARRMESLKDTLHALEIDLNEDAVKEMNTLADRAVSQLS